MRWGHWWYSRARWSAVARSVFERAALEGYLQGSHASLKVLESTLEFFSPKFKALKVLENRTGAWKSLNFIPQVLESPWIQQFKLCDISNFVKQHLYRTGMHMLYLLRNLPGILPNTGFVNNRHVLFLSTKTVAKIKEIDIKYCCNTVHAVNFVENWSLKMQP